MGIISLELSAFIIYIFSILEHCTYYSQLLIQFQYYQYNATFEMVVLGVLGLKQVNFLSKATNHIVPVWNVLFK